MVLAFQPGWMNTELNVYMHARTTVPHSSIAILANFTSSMIVWMEKSKSRSVCYQSLEQILPEAIGFYVVLTNRDGFFIFPSISITIEICNEMYTIQSGDGLE